MNPKGIFLVAPHRSICFHRYDHWAPVGDGGWKVKMCWKCKRVVVFAGSQDDVYVRTAPSDLPAEFCLKWHLVGMTPPFPVRRR